MTCAPPHARYLLARGASLGLAVLVGGLLAFGDGCLEIEADELAERWG